MDQTIFNKVESYILKVFIESNFKGNLVQFESIVGILVRGKFVVALLIFYNLLDVNICSLQVVSPRKNDLIELLIVVSDAEVKVQKPQIGVLDNVFWQ